MSSAEDRILHRIKSRGPQTTDSMAQFLAISLPGARKHLAVLAAKELISHDDEARGIGRPRRVWRLTAKAESRFPDSHAVLTLEMIDAVRDLYGEPGLDRLIARREEQAIGRYEAALKSQSSLGQKIARLAELRSEEGYLAEWQTLPDGAFLLSENHCPICAAARHCQGFCRSELEIFQALLGAAATVERSEHILAGARRCAYRIVPVLVPAHG